MWIGAHFSESVGIHFLENVCTSRSLYATIPIQTYSGPIYEYESFRFRCLQISRQYVSLSPEWAISV